MKKEKVPMSARYRARVLSVSLVLTLCALTTLSFATGRGPRVAVLPIGDNAPPSLNAARVGVSHVESLLNRQGGLDVVDSGTVAAAVREIQERGVVEQVDWESIADRLDLELVALLDVVEARVKYLGAQESATSDGNRHLYEGKATVRVTVVDVAEGVTLFDEEVTGKKTDGYDEPYDDSKYADVVAAVRDIVAIFDDKKEQGGQSLTEEYAPLAMTALERAVKKLADPLREAFPIRGTVILVEGRMLTVDIGSDAGVRKGMKFDLTRPGKTVIHPTTGEEISTGEERVGQAKVVRVSSTTAELKASASVASKVEVGYSVVGSK